MFLGPPGAGKGTQAVELTRKLGVPQLSTGDLLRAAVAEGSELGRAADGHMRAGRLVPDELVLEILRDRLRRPDAARGYVLDGFPRTLAQAVALDAMARPDVVVFFELDPGELLLRLSGRRICPSCGSIYNVVSNPPRTPEHCDRDGSPLLQRPDDRPEAVEVRLRVYAELTVPLLEHYRSLGLLRTLDASGAPATVAERLRRLLDEPASGAASPRAAESL